MPETTPPPWQLPPLVPAPAANDQKNEVLYEISSDISNPHRRNFRRTPLFQAWVHLLSSPPPIANISILERGAVRPTYQTLRDSTACFKGVKRALNDQENGNEVIVYVLKPEATVGYEVRMGAPIRAVEIPDGFVLTVLVVLKPSLQTDDNEISGVVTRIELVESDAANDALPKNHASRYGEQLW